MFQLSKFRLSKLSLVFLPFLAWSLQGCTIEDDVAEDMLVKTDEMEYSVDDTDAERAAFLVECHKCIQGDLSNLPWIIKTYHSSFTASKNYKPGQFKYQYITSTQAYEKCAEKAKAMGDNSAMSQLIIRPARSARISRYFYIYNDYIQGAYWLQRLVNINGEKDGYYTAGRIFIQDMRTISIGVQLLERSARLGNREARQMLLGLMQPGSSYYHSITQNTLIEDERNSDDAERSEEKLEQTISTTEDLALPTTNNGEVSALGNTTSQTTSDYQSDATISVDSDLSQIQEALNSSSVDNIQITSQTIAEQQARDKSKAASQQATQDLQTDENSVADGYSNFNVDRERESNAITRDSTVYQSHPDTTAAKQAQERRVFDNFTGVNQTQSQTKQSATTSSQSKTNNTLKSTVGQSSEAKANMGLTNDNIPIHALPSKKLHDNAERIKEVKAKADAAAAAAEQQQ